MKPLFTAGAPIFDQHWARVGSGVDETIVDSGDDRAETAKCEVNGDVDLALEGAPPGT